jgi:hypothetical protein
MDCTAGGASACCWELHSEPLAGSKEGSRRRRLPYFGMTGSRQERFSTCEEWKPISKPRLEAVPWVRHYKDCKDRQDSEK